MGLSEQSSTALQSPMVLQPSREQSAKPTTDQQPSMDLLRPKERRVRLPMEPQPSKAPCVQLPMVPLQPTEQHALQPTDLQQPKERERLSLSQRDLLRVNPQPPTNPPRRRVRRRVPPRQRPTEEPEAKEPIHSTSLAGHD